MKTSENHKYKVGRRLVYTGPGGVSQEVTVTALVTDGRPLYESPMYWVTGDDHGRDWPSSESRLSEPAAAVDGIKEAK